MTPDEKLDWFPLKYLRFLVGTSKMKADEIGAYTLLLIHQWRKYYIPLDEGEIEDISKLPVKKLSRVLRKFSKTEKGYQNTFLEEVRSEQYEKLANSSERGRNAANSRWKKDAQAMHVHSTSIADAMQPDAIRREEKRKEEKRRELRAFFDQSVTWKEALCMKHKVRPDSLPAYFDSFFIHLTTQKKDWVSDVEAMAHFDNWLGKNKNAAAPSASKRKLLS